MIGQRMPLINEEKLSRSSSLNPFREDDDEDIENGFGPRDKLLGDNSLKSPFKDEDSLDRTRKMAMEAELIGNSVLEDLRRQREQLMRARQHLEGVDTDLDRGNQILKKMLRRLQTHKMLTSFILFLLCIAIIFILYRKMFS